MKGAPAKPISAVRGASASSAARTRRTVSMMGAARSATPAARRAPMAAASRTGSSSGPSPSAKRSGWPMAQGTMRMSENRMAASKP